jgi:hypothetical protein
MSFDFGLIKVQASALDALRLRPDRSSAAGVYPFGNAEGPEPFDFTQDRLRRGIQGNA